MISKYCFSKNHFYQHFHEVKIDGVVVATIENIDPIQNNDVRVGNAPRYPGEMIFENI